MSEPSFIRVGQREFAVSNLEKALYRSGFTKAQVLDYYGRVSDFLLPHFRDRPVTLLRFPDGVSGEKFYEKNAPGFTPDWIETFAVPRTSEPGNINYILINDVPTLIWVANMAALELHPFLHRVPEIQQPTHVVFDLDPGEGADVLDCAEVAFLLRDLLKQIELDAFPKVSGSKGLQIYVPLNIAINYESTHAFARSIADQMAREHSGRIVSLMAKDLRKGKVFIDWSQNIDKKTTVGVYSLRAKRDVPHVSLPVAWEELRDAIKRKKAEALFFEPEPALKRLNKVGDLFAPVLTLKQRLPDQFMELSGAAIEAPAPKRLHRYAAKRNFRKTTEPSALIPKRSMQGSRRRFVVQKHAASHLHYDFRLEMHDVLKSWAVPKGVPLKQSEKRSAFQTEDHPLAYFDFEGVIPEGEYGGGTVMVWDVGTYEPIEGNIYHGDLTFYMTGKKLKGEWRLTKIKSDDDQKPVWLLTKTGADARPVTLKQADRSVLTGRSMEEIAAEKNAVWRSDESPIEAKPRQQHSASRKEKKIKAPEFVPPMKATTTEKLPEGPDWLYEVKWDGYRAIAIKDRKTVRLLSLKNRSLASDFPAVVEAVRSIDVNTAMLDGEVVAVNVKGQPSFQALQNRSSSGKEWLLVYYAFDLLNLEGEDLRHLKLEERRQKLERILTGTEVRFSGELRGSAASVTSAVKRLKLEGIVAKRRDSAYVANTRSRAWLKLKLSAQQELVIGGYNPDGRNFQSLLVGYYEHNKLMYAGKVRQGFTPHSRASLFKQLQPFETNTCPFKNLPSSKTGHFGEGVTPEDMKKLKWVKPKLVAQITFTEWTSYGLLRHASFMGIRTDKNPEEVAREISNV